MMAFRIPDMLDPDEEQEPVTAPNTCMSQRKKKIM
jgi:hypothetical protein